MKQVDIKKENIDQESISKAIHYINQSHVDQDRINQSHINQNGTALHADIPAQAVTIPAGDILDKTTLLTSLACACEFPDYFSHNWDSTWDCLTDSDVMHLMLDLTGAKSINTEDFNMFKCIIEDAYRDFGKPQLWIIVPSADEV
ncbi:barstar family protein [Psychrobacter sp. PP-21]|uniref:barstar family protein n=1 Tax=Psychrobacter sp. PP-21 TaxID=2957503 RepID=UPI0029A935C6|nr:barstar family protein [Psychrobacter sp. PP-21]MDX2373746.1 barstar family protein [Psychrobacter sp. PP-21]